MAKKTSEIALESSQGGSSGSKKESSPTRPGPVEMRKNEENTWLAWTQVCKLIYL